MNSDHEQREERKCCVVAFCNFPTFVLYILTKKGTKGLALSHSNLCNVVIFDLNKMGLNHIKESFVLCFSHWAFLSHLSLDGVGLIPGKQVMHERHLIRSQRRFFFFFLPRVHSWFLTGMQCCDF